MAGDALPLGTVGAALLLTLIPFALLATTSFVKLSVVLSLLRNALGLVEVPSGLVITLLAALLSVIVMAPVVSQISQRVEPLVQAPELSKPLSPEGRRTWGQLGQAVAEPVRAFLVRHAGSAERALFTRLSRQSQSDVADDALTILLPAFLVSELSDALRLGVLLFVPFLVVDLLVAILLTALGMTALSAQTLSLPMKLLLFVSVDGFSLLSESLVSGYL